MDLPAPFPSRKRLAALTALAGAVLAAHAWLLASPLLPAADVAPALAHNAVQAATRALSTRTVVLVRAPATQAAPAAPALAAPRPSTPASTRVAQPRAPSASIAPPSLVPVAGVDLPPQAAEELPESVPKVALDDVSSEVSLLDTALDSTAAPSTPITETPGTAVTPAQDVQVAANHTGPARVDGAQPAVVPFAPPPSARLNYEVQIEYRGVRQNISGVLDWRNDGESYRLHMVVAVPFLGSRVQLSEGRLGRNGIHPKRFSEKTRSERAAHFDEAGSRIRYSANTPDAPLLPGHQDRLSVFMQLAGLVQARPERYAAGQTVQIPTSGVRESETWTFEIKGLETISLPRGDVAALHLRRLPRKEFDTTVDVWLAPSMGHLPVRMRLLEANGNVADQILITP